jgi:hypothetical protein
MISVRVPCRPPRAALLTVGLLLQVKYCSPECQRAQWNLNGHKIACKGYQAGRSARAVAAECAATAVADAAGEDGDCIICLTSDPRPIQSGCGCRGDAGLAHIECRIEAAVYARVARAISNSPEPQSSRLRASVGTELSTCL